MFELRWSSGAFQRVHFDEVKVRYFGDHIKSNESCTTGKMFDKFTLGNTVLIFLLFSCTLYKVSVPCLFNSNT